MGWASGSELLKNIVGILDKNLAPNVRVNVYRQLIRSFQSFDCDTIDECVSKKYPDFTKAYKKEYPGRDEDELD